MADDQRGQMDTAAIAVHELFESYVRAGFTRAEALDLVASHIAASTGAGDNKP